MNISKNFRFCRSTGPGWYGMAWVRGSIAIAAFAGLLAVGAQAFEVAKTSSGAEIKWLVPNMTYLVNSGGAPAGYATAAINAGRAWDGSGGKFRFFYGGTTTSHDYGVKDGKNIVDFGSLDSSIVGQCYRWFSSASGRLTDTDLRLNSTKPWGGTGGYDVQSVITHEMGHAVGLADLYGTDSATRAKTMYGLSTKGDTSPRMLDGDDMAGIRYLYRVANGDDLTAFNRTTAQWFIYSLSKNDVLYSGKAWGYAGVVPVSADFNNDGFAELGVYDQNNGCWYVCNPRNNSIVLYGVAWGFKGAVAVPADYDGDGYAELAVYHAASGNWYIYNHRTAKVTIVAWGFAGATAVPADYNGDGFDDLGVYYPPTGSWFIYDLRAKKTLENNLQWGFAGTVPVVGDFNGDGKADLGVYYTAGSRWYILNRVTKTTIASGLVWGFSGATPFAADFNGDKVDDLCLYYSAAAAWYAYDLTKSYAFMIGMPWGAAGLTPVRGNYGP